MRSGGEVFVDVCQFAPGGVVHAEALVGSRNVSVRFKKEPV